MTYWRLHYHLIWATHEREPSLTLKAEKIFYGVLYAKAQELGVKIHTAGNIEHHVHVVASIPPKLAVAECVRQLKGASTFAINNLANGRGAFRWQVGYGALTISKRSLETVMAYAANQKQHHQAGKTIAVYEEINDE